jgi:Asp/Glu/hydantoin racemase
MNIIYGGHTVYGIPIGIILLDTKFPRIKGDIGNANTFRFPVMYKVVKGAKSQRVIDGDRTLLKPFIEAAKYLEKQGVKAITTSCGFLALFQKDIALSVNIPVFTSSLLLVPMVSNLIVKEKKIGIITANSDCLTEKHFNSVGWSTQKYNVVIYGMQNFSNFYESFVLNKSALDEDLVTREMINVSKLVIKQHPEIGAFVFECTNMPPYAKAVQQATGRPIFDIVTLTNFIYNSVENKEY